jgi:hypothetical protein
VSLRVGERDGEDLHGAEDGTESEADGEERRDAGGAEGGR